jgi:hypothetical protein
MGYGRPNPRWDSAILALLGGKTQAEAAAAAGVHERTLRTWLALPDFVEQLRADRRRVVDAVANKLQAAAGKAVDKLEGLLDCGHRPTECRAAIAICEMAKEHFELSDVLARLEQLELAGRRRARA